jgi:hypothetical protein
LDYFVTIISSTESVTGITNHEDSCKIDKTTLDVVARFEKCMVDALKSIHNSNKDEKIRKSNESTCNICYINIIHESFSLLLNGA